MKKGILFIILCVFGGPVLAETTCDKKVPDDHARKRAILFLKQENVQRKYKSYPETTTEQKCHWVVSFKQRDWETNKSPKAIVGVHITTGKAQWLPLK